MYHSWGFHNKSNLIHLLLFLSLHFAIEHLPQAARGQSSDIFEIGRLNLRLPDEDGSSSSTPGDTSLSAAANSSAPLVWQPLRATFRPLNRSPQPDAPAPPEPLALVSNGDSAFESPLSSPPGRSLAGGSTSAASSNIDRSFFVPIITSTPATPTTAAAITTPSPIFASPSPSSLDSEDQPTRVPLSRFRPTKSPSVDAQSQPLNSNLFPPPNSGSQFSTNNTSYRITNDCFECICEASTSCNVNSRCQTSDVRHTRCGMFLISYDQWLETGLSSQLVNREALIRDAAADERAFYECVTKRDCSERLLSIYMQRKARDCDKDGRIDCYDVAAIHQGGTDQCNSEGLLESQYWSDFNACFGFGRR